jgi:hypothetical protein
MRFSDGDFDVHYDPAQVEPEDLLAAVHGAGDQYAATIK